MFKKMLLKITLINMAIVMIIVTIILCGVFFIMRIELVNASEKILVSMATDKLETTPLGEHPSGPPFQKIKPPRENEFFYIRLDQQKRFVSISPSVTFDREQINSLITAALATTWDRGIAKLSESQVFRFQKLLLQDQSISLVFIDISSEQNALSSLLRAIVISGGIGCLLFLFGSVVVARRSVAPVKEAWQKQIDFVADASHELRSPLAVAAANLDVVLGEGDQTVESQLRWLTNIKNEQLRMAKLIDDLLFLASCDGRKKVEKKRFDVSQALNEVVGSMSVLFTEKAITLNKEIDSAQMLNGNEARIKQLLVILLDNACKYTPSGGWVTAKLIGTKAEIVISISDSGAGISESERQRIFDRFYRSDKSRSRATGGSGLGLAIAVQIVAEHHGTISVANEAGAGAVFTVRLPVKLTSRHLSQFNL
ncbi:MAG: HAMP domain-containing sensor histidine kinase [Negativicutes bacterium]|jgi:signal transduction histidine kinase